MAHEAFKAKAGYWRNGHKPVTTSSHFNGMLFVILTSWLLVPPGYLFLQDYSYLFIS